MRKYFVILILPLLAACTSKGPKEAVVSGSLPNFADSVVYLSAKGLTDTIYLNSDKTFSYKVMLDKPVLYNLRAYRSQLQVYLNPGDSIYVAIDFVNPQEGPKFSGSLDKVNQYLFNRNITLGDLMGNWQEVFGKEAEDFNLKIDSIKAPLVGLLDSIKTAKKDIVAFEKARIDYFILNLKASYPEYHSYLMGIEVDPDSVDYSYFEGFDPNNSDYLMFDDYTSLVQSFVMSKLYKEVKKADYEAMPAEKKYAQLFAVIDSNITNHEVRDYLKQNEMIEELEYGKFYEMSGIVSKFLSDCQSSGYKNIISTIYNSKMLVAPGKPAPVFKYKDINGKEVALEDLKGKLVYIDFWATWCGPCRHELPFLEKLQDDYKGQKITFVSMSLDDDFTAWEAKVKGDKMKGVQLHADGAWASDAAKNYQIKGIPTFYLVDANGLIILPNAPRPSSEEIRPLIDENLKKL